MADEHPLFKSTRVGARPSPISILRNEKMLWMGSCFVESMSKFLEQYQYQAIINPFGVIFHPMVLEKLLAMEAKEIFKCNFERRGVWQNFWLGAPFGAESENALNHKIENAARLINESILTSNWLVMTWGTAFWYAHEEKGMVGKCHKFPQNHFQKQLSTIEEIVEIWKERITRIRQKNPKLKVLLTVSPVRHTRDGLEGNAISKSTMRLAIMQLQSKLKDVFYFPAFEIVVDELRDYRFFNADLIHPNNEAAAYIWNQFSNQYFTPEDQKINALIRDISLQQQHVSNINFGEDYDAQMRSLNLKKESLAAKLKP